MNMTALSIIVPCFNETESIDLFYDELLKNLTFIEDYELIFIDDGSSDNTLSKIKALADRDNHIRYISFSRNFGKESALYAGLAKSRGDYVVLMDADLQDPPSMLEEMFSSIRTGDYDSIATRRVSRKGEPFIRSISARLFYKLINKISDLEIVDGARDFRMMNRQFVDAVLQLNEYNRFSKGIFNWVGFKTKWMEYENIERINGETSWSFWKLCRYSTESIVSFSTLPLSISTFFGILFSIIAFILIVIIVLRKLLFSDPVQGWASTICIILFLGGIQLFSIGILGKYLEKTYNETKNRPIFIIKESNLDEN